jgi:hypothetical protein
LHRAKLRRYFRVTIARTVDHDWQKKNLFIRHRVRALGGKFPFEPKITLEPRLRRRRNHRHKQRTRTDLSANLRIPLIAPDQLALVEPHLHVHGTQRLTDALHHFRVLRGVAQKNGFRGITHNDIVACKIWSNRGSSCKRDHNGSMRISFGEGVLVDSQIEDFFVGAGLPRDFS